MRAYRGRAGDPDADGEFTARIAKRAADDGEVGLRVWRPGAHCSFGRRDTTHDGYPDAFAAAVEHGFPPRVRRVGGHPVVFTDSTVAVALALPIDDIRDGVTDRYEEVASAVQRALWRLGVPAQRGEPDGAFCPGTPSLQWTGKLAGFAQRIQRNVALVSGVVIVDDHGTIADVLDPIYEALELHFAPETVGSIERAGGRVDPRAAVQRIEESLTDDRDAAIERVDQER